MADMKADHPNLSTSAVASWRLWAFVVASAIHAFEVILDLFRAEVERITNKVAPGTERWLAEMCYRFQNGHELLFDEKTAQLYYAEDDEAARIIKVVAIVSARKKVLIKVAKQDENGLIVPLSADELHNFYGYIEAIKFAGLTISIISTPADLIRYKLEVFVDPFTPIATTRQNIQDALEAFKTARSFDAKFYPERLHEKIMAAGGVTTAKLHSVERKGATEPAFVPVEIVDELAAGYFEYSDDCTLIETSLNDL